MSDDNSSLSFPFRQNNDEMSEYAHDYLTEHQEEISNNFNFDKPGFDPSGLFYDEKTTNISASNTSQSSKSNPSSEIKSENNSERSTNSSATDKKEKINFKSLKIYLVDDIKYSPYNIIKKIKNKIINNILCFLCSIFLITLIGSRYDFISGKCNSFKI